MSTSKTKKNLKRIIFMRHGISVDRDDFKGEDQARPLTEKGIKKTRKIAKSMATLLGADLVVTSDFRRARETCEICVDAFASHGETSIRIVESPAIRPNGTWDDWMKAMDLICGDFPNAVSILVVGHEPNLSLLVGKMIAVAPASLSFKKAGVAVLERLDVSSWQLVAFIPPKFWTL
jgi:phosphohistidine phosphatase